MLTSIWIVEVRILLYTTPLVHINGSYTTKIKYAIHYDTSSSIDWYILVCVLVCVPEAQGNCDVLNIAQVSYFQAQTSQTQLRTTLATRMTH